MLFLTFGTANTWFVEWKIVWKTYSTAKALSITQKVEIINKKEFATATLNENNEIFVVHMAALSVVDLNVHPSQHVQIALLEVEEFIIASKYADYTDVFFPDIQIKTDTSNYDISGILSQLTSDSGQ